jgi:hypothetical protein
MGTPEQKRRLPVLDAAGISEDEMVANFRLWRMAQKYSPEKAHSFVNPKSANE